RIARSVQRQVDAVVNNDDESVQYEAQESGGSMEGEAKTAAAGTGTSAEGKQKRGEPTGVIREMGRSFLTALIITGGVPIMYIAWFWLRAGMTRHPHGLGAAPCIDLIGMIATAAVFAPLVWLHTEALRRLREPWAHLWAFLCLPVLIIGATLLPMYLGF
ncbi:hypothetical protein LTR53_017147, partial [Teratosphaeriaceae sp. CCFEE 6253]